MTAGGCLMVDASLSPDGRSLTMRVPLKFRRRGGRKLVVAADGSTTPATRRAQTASALVKAVVNAHRCQRMLESGDYATIGELAAAEKVNPSYMSRVLRLTLLAPDIVEAVMDGRQVAEAQVADQLQPIPRVWQDQANAPFPSPKP